MSNDNRILAVAMNYHLEEKGKPDGKPVYLVSKDTLVRIKSDVLGVPSQDYLNDRLPSLSESYTGVVTIEVHPSLIDVFYSQRSIPSTLVTNRIPLYPHQFVILKDAMGSSQSALLKVSSDTKQLEALKFGNESVWGITARNAQQRMAFELLLNDDIPLVTLTGKAGTGKTLLTLAAGLLKVEDEQVYKKLVIGRPVVPMGKISVICRAKKRRSCADGCSRYTTTSNICSIRKRTMTSIKSLRA